MLLGGGMGMPQEHHDRADYQSRSAQAGPGDPFAKYPPAEQQSDNRIHETV